MKRLILAAVLLASCGGGYGIDQKVKDNSVEVIQNVRRWCDRDTGNLLYLNFASGSIAVVPEGCR